MTRSPLLAGALVAGAFVVGRLLAPAPSPEPPRERVVHAPPEIRTIVRSEPQPVLVPAPVLEPVAPSDEVVTQRATAFAEAKRVVDRAVGAGRWTPDDARALLDELPRIAPEQFDELMSTLVTSVNAQTLKLEAASLLDPT